MEHIKFVVLIFTVMKTSNIMSEYAGAFLHYAAMTVYEVCPESSRIFHIKIFPSFLEAIQPCRPQSTRLYFVCTAASVSATF
jgi:hypothetical protein